MILAHKIALDPTVVQRTYFAKAAGCDRFVWNVALEMWNAEYKAGGKPNANELQKRFNSVKYAQYPWMREVHRDAHAHPFMRLQRAWRVYFNAVKTGGRTSQPQFHKKGHKDSFYVANDQFRVDGIKVRLPIVGLVRMREPLRFAGKIMGARVIRYADRWYICIQVEVAHPGRQRTGNGIAGVDVGIKNAATITRELGASVDTECICPPMPFTKALRQLCRVQRKMCRRKVGGRNRAKLSRRLARAHDRVGCVRVDFWNKLTTRLCRENQAVAIEHLNVKGMVKNRHLSRALSDVGFGMFRQQMQYKVKLYGTLLVLADRWYPSSKTCSRCGAVKMVLGLGDRVFRCDQCGHVQDRDVNASRNLCALAKVPAACGEHTLGDSGLVAPLVEPRTTRCREQAGGYKALRIAQGE